MTNFKHWTQTLKPEDLLRETSDSNGLFCWVCPASDYCEEVVKMNRMTWEEKPCKVIFWEWANRTYKHSRRKKPRQPRENYDIMQDKPTKVTEE